MGFLSGRVSCSRFRVLGRSPRQFGPEHLEQLGQHVIGSGRIASGDGTQSGWIAGDHILDTNFDLAKNVINDTLQFALRIDSLKIPGELMRAYTLIELAGLSAGNPSGIPSGRQKREARALAKEKLDQLAEDGRFIRQKAYPLLWDCQSNELLLTSNSAAVLDRVVPLFQETFRARLEPIGAGGQASQFAEKQGQMRNLDDCRPAAIVPKVTPQDYAWMVDEAGRDFLGNEFLIWLWYMVEEDTDTIKVGDGSEVTVMFARSLVLECPRGMTGREAITSEGPASLPEARRAIQAGKLPRKAGLTLVRHDKQYELTLQAESLSIFGARLPPPEETEDRPKLEERVTSVRHLIETVVLLYEAFIQRRLGSQWNKELSAIQKWVQAEGRSRRVSDA
jgi:hypothetical protein